MPEEVRNLLEAAMVDLDGKISSLDPGTPARAALVQEMEVYGKLLVSDYQAGQTAIDMEEKRKLSVKADRRKLFGELSKATLPPMIAAGASIYGSLMLLRLKLSLEDEGQYLGNDVFKWAKDFILKLKTS